MKDKGDRYYVEGVGLSVLTVYEIIAFAMTYYFSRGYNDTKFLS